MILIATLLLAVTPASWGHLQKGPYAVGYKLIDRYDYTRPFWTAADLDGKPRTIERARPMRISVWYPAKESNTPFMTMGDYIDQMGVEDRMTASITDEQKRNARNALFSFQLLRAATAEQRAKLDTITTLAQRNAPAASGTFPLILYSLGSAAPAAITPEYLASHGYVVMQMPRLGAFAGLPPDSPFDMPDKIADTNFLLQTAHEFPNADLHDIGAIGFSAGGRWALSEAMRTADVHAVVSLDSVMLFNDATATNWRALPLYDLNAVRVPVLHMIRRTWVPQQDASMWEKLRFADRTQIVFEDPKLDHFDFQSLGFVLTLTGWRAADAEVVSDTFHRFNELTLSFLDHNLKAAPAVTPTADHATITHLASVPAPIQVADVMNAIAEGKTELALKLGAKNVDEPTINLAGYQLLANQRIEDAIRILQMNVDNHPDSANAYDSLGDAYLAAGQPEKAAELAKKAEELLAKDTTTPEARKQAIAASIQAKLKK
jgi:tetratricopeptide (TPR) repeat protein